MEQSPRLGCWEAVGAMDDTSFSSCSEEREGLELRCFLSFILLIRALGRKRVGDSFHMGEAFGSYGFMEENGC